MKGKAILIAFLIILAGVSYSSSDLPALYIVYGFVKYVNGTEVCNATVYVKNLDRGIVKTKVTSCEGNDKGYYAVVFDASKHEYNWDEKIYVEVFKGNLYGNATSTFTPADPPKKLVNVVLSSTNPGTKAKATGPKGISNKKDIVITYTYTGHPNHVSIYYSNDENETWHLAGNDSSLDGKYNFTLPKDGKYSFIAVAIGGGSNESIPQPGEKAESYFYLLDSVPPTIKIKYPENNSYVKGGSLLIRWIANDDIDTSLNIKMQYRMEGYWIWSQPKQLPNNGSYEWNMPPFPDKSKIVLRLTAEDDAGNNEYDDIHITIDDVAPTTTLQHGMPYYNGYITSSTPLYINASDDGAGIKEIHYIIDGVENIAYNNISFTIPTEGNHTIEYYSIDAVGNEEQHHIATYYVDDVAPTTTLQHGTPYYNGYITSSTPLYINASDDASGVKEIHYIIDGVEKAANNNIIFNLSGYSDGWHTIKYYSIDNLGNIESMHNISYYLDNSAPETSIVLNPSMPNGNNGWYISNVMISISSIDNGTGVNKTYYSIDGREFEVYNATTITISQDGIHEMKYYAIDNLGNGEAIKSITIKIDKTKPTIQLVKYPSHAVNNGSVYFEWKGNENALYSYRIENHSGWSEWSYEKSYKAVLGEGNYTFMVRARDVAGNMNEISYSFSINFSHLITYLRIHPSHGNIIGAGAKINFTSSIPATTYYRIWHNGWYPTPGAAAGKNNCFIKYRGNFSLGELSHLIGLPIEGGKYYVEYYSVDAGNVERVRNASFILDLTLPMISIFAGKNVTCNANISITINASDDFGLSNTLLYFSYSENKSWKNWNLIGKNISHYLFNFSDVGFYAFKVVATDYAGNSNTSEWIIKFYQADLNEDGSVDIFDIVKLTKHLNTASLQYDLDGNGIVDIEDIALLLQNVL